MLKSFMYFWLPSLVGGSCLSSSFVSFFVRDYFEMAHVAFAWLKCGSNGVEPMEG